MTVDSRATHQVFKHLKRNNVFTEESESTTNTSVRSIYSAN